MINEKNYYSFLIAESANLRLRKKLYNKRNHQYLSQYNKKKPTYLLGCG